MPIMFMDDDDDVMPVPTNLQSTLASTDARRTIYARCLKMADDQSFDMMLQSYTRKCCEVEVTGKKT